MIHNLHDIFTANYLRILGIIVKHYVPFCYIQGSSSTDLLEVCALHQESRVCDVQHLHKNQ